uniref:Uncharacterized protein n=1 Tax=Physcomitrium patens TaxID=3218 RepID=A0A2K1KZK7_PHYPA|nr:hypothetical protein PHYPA_002016 [Physcomitrium patens]
MFGVFLAATAPKVNPCKTLTLGVLMNTKGLVELVVLNIGKDRGVLNEETFAIMVLMALESAGSRDQIVAAFETYGQLSKVCYIS